MSIVASTTKASASRFLESLKSITGVVSAGRVGFRAQADVPKRHVGIVALIAKADAAAATAASAAGADAIEVRTATIREARALVTAASIPVGLVAPATADAAYAAEAVAAGVDWLHLDLEAPIATLSWEGPARFISVPADLDLRLVAAFNGPFAEAIVASPAADDALDLAAGLRLRLIGEVVRKPLLLTLTAGQPTVSSAEVEALGVNAVIVPVTAEDANSTIAALRASLERPHEHR